MRVLTCIVAFSFNDELKKCINNLISQTYTTDIFVTNNKLGGCFLDEFLSFLESEYDIKSCNTGFLYLSLEITKGEHSFNLLIEQSEYNSGFAYGCNKGLKKALEEAYDFCWLLNPDAYPAPDALHHLVSSYCSGTLMGSKVCGTDNEKGFPSLGYVTEYYRVKNTKVSNFKTLFLSGASLLIPLEVIKSVGFLNENFFLYWEEVEYCSRVHSKGYKLKVVEESVVKHDFGALIGDKSTLQTYYSIRNQYLFTLMNESKLKGVYFILVAFLAKSIKFFLKGDFSSFKLNFKALLRSLSIDINDFSMGKSTPGKYDSDIF